MEARYNLELRDRDPATVEDLVLDGCESAEIEGITDKLINLQHVANNCPELLHLNLASNKIGKVEDLAPLKKLKLAELDLFNNPVTEGAAESEYRSKVFEAIPSLQILDGADINGEEVDDSLDGEDDLGDEDSGDESGSDIDGPGLSYLDNSQLDEDESEEYKPSDPEVSGEDAAKRGLKRRNEGTNGGEGDVKKKADE
ncbi:unnamed protein product [Strongylus vulgaris]|uniref:U2A'/phosphoprotein 32 family A C-terminal domain-containing protein n=1 Tax=Strongylus vulgaris TaxID=40348 RepID=A0A3P7JLE2_STRVU|nr:unnamed protein product [Strongylus vulgaris]